MYWQALEPLIEQSKAQLTAWCKEVRERFTDVAIHASPLVPLPAQYEGEEFAESYEFRSMMDRRRRHVEAHLEGYEKQARELDAKILRIQDPQKALEEEHERDAHARKVYALTLGCDEAEVPIAVAAMPLASEVFRYFFICH